MPNRCALLAGLLALLALESAGAEALHCAGDMLAPFEASYEVVRNDKRLGHAELELEHENGTWTYTMNTKSERGLSGLLGGHVLERTEFEYVRGEPRPLSYRYKRGVSFSSKSTFAEFDWDAERASGNYKKKEWVLPLTRGQTDRMLVNLLLMRALARGAPRIAFDTIEKGKLDQLSFERTGTLEVDTAAGTFSTVIVERQHRNKARQTHSWHAPELAYLPVRLRQIDGDDDETIELTLESVEFLPCE